MNRMTRIALGVLALSAFAGRDAAAQWNVARLDTDRNRVFVSSGLDPALVVSLGYARSLPVSGHDVQLVGDVGLAGGHLDTHDFRARLGVQSSLLRWRSVHLTGSATFITRGTQNIIYRGLNFGSDFTGTLGVYRRHWFATSEFGFDKAIITHVQNTQYYRDTFYADAKDGWYLTGGGNFHGGLAGGHLDTHDFRARLGAQSSVVHWRSLHLTGSATFITRGTQNIIYRGLNFGSDVTGTLGVYRRHWFAAGEFGFDKAIITHVTNTQYYRDNFYADAKDGWYLTGGGNFHGGLAGGVALGPTELVARAGLRATERFNAVMPPFYASVGLGVGF